MESGICCSRKNIKGVFLYSLHLTSPGFKIRLSHFSLRSRNMQMGVFVSEREREREREMVKSKVSHPTKKVCKGKEGGILKDQVRVLAMCVKK